ncbi:histidine kinase [Gleimia sp. 6138-11-ORH1]|uniref:histidine kinase n=1 Tax=Gleimia sp. 6138-11-ORH1 TaxID=2973937 RepID=UPI002168C4E1|nr:histidine kinase [Gleimia sp. 6138-11-ORH1]MCS4484180.1 histidine kinase [Gleimia sp. 6138-11-ORH1]
MAKKWQLQADPEKTWLVLGHSAPFLVFLSFPVYAAYSVGAFTTRGLQILGSTAVFAITYLLTSIAVPIAPEERKLTARFIFWHSLLFIVALLYFLLAYFGGGSGMVFYISYLSALWILQAPKYLVSVGGILSIVIAAALSFFVPGEYRFGVVVIALANLSFWMTRRNIEEEKISLETAARDVLFAQERERNRISSDLHDTLGQTLTALGLKAELSQKMLEAGRTDLVQKELAELQVLTREVLGDVRSVVSANRFLDLVEEIKAAEKLCRSVGTCFELNDQSASLTVEQRTICAYVLRESVTNALRHGEPTLIKVEITPTHLWISNDITVIKPTKGMGLGLESLRQRIGKLGVLETRKEHGQWHLTVTFTNEMAVQND